MIHHTSLQLTERFTRVAFEPKLCMVSMLMAVVKQNKQLCIHSDFVMLCKQLLYKLPQCAFGVMTHPFVTIINMRLI